MDSTAQAIVTRIEQIVDARPDLNQRTLAERAGLSPTQMNRVMNHQRKITATELAMIAEALGVPASELLGETRPAVRPHTCGVGGPGSGEIECAHQWLDRPESDTRECLICGTEVAG